MRIALAPEGTRGDVYPLLELGSWLQSQGHEVRMCAPPDFASAVRARGLEHRSVGRDVREELSRQARAIVRGGWRMSREADRFLREGIPEQVRDLLAALPGCDLVLGAGVQIGAPSVAESLGIPYRYIAYCPAILPSRAHPPFVIERQSLPGWLNRVLWRAFLAVMNWQVKPLLDRERASLGLSPVSDLFRHMATERPLFAMDPVLAELPTDAGPCGEVLGCLHSEEAGPLPPKLEDFLAAGDAPVYMGFGSMTDPDPRATTRTLLEAVRRAGCRALISRGWAGLGDEALPEDIHVIDSVDHPALFPRVAAVVHHGGAGTTTAAARAGVPQVVVPHVLDQFYWARRVHALGVSPPALPRRRLEPQGLAARLRAALDSELGAERARELAERMRVARPPRSAWQQVLEPITAE